MESKPKSKNMLFIALLIIVVLALLWWWQSGTMIPADNESGIETQSGELVSPPTLLDDTTPVINQDLQGINDIDLESELQQINADIDSL